MDTEQTAQFIQALAHGLAYPQRTPILKRPDDVGLAYEDIFFPALDGLPLEGWFIPADSDRLVICNHFGPSNRQGYPGHLDGFPASNGVEVDYLPKYKALHDAGYNVLAYDLRNHGLSSAGNGGISGVGLTEWRDVIGSIRFAKSRPDTKDMKVSLQSLCIGCNSTLVAMRKCPEDFEHVRSFIAIQPVVGGSLIELSCRAMGIENGVELFEPVFHHMTGFRVAEYDMRAYAKDVRVPTLVVQVKDDVITKSADIQAIYDGIESTDKQLFWIEGTPIRHHGYTYFAEHPESMIEWYDAHE
ncbi:MAG: lysophospholipase [Myxococcales bacterium FL481]|nr:MAG: lysophospholipase [Myxococcales bacterium FL481]